ncbi:hypothetical protein QF049_000491 [Paenibacillus sp. W4I10]|uniref:hypothetical protein n=1 Tax=Paenibacillus sp. W4I10 TaxID=3042298 RepID=UPI00277FFFEA|nr:hypothetical protein [Paenibacillus sp. W4I10]MDQ0719230.1 hypothetical protein [Paenibacillus sp. W4I10]
MQEEKKSARKAGGKKIGVEKEVKVQDLLSIIESIYRMSKNPLMGSGANSSQIKNFLKTLQPIKGMSLQELTDIISNLIEEKSPERDEIVDSLKVLDISNAEIRNMCMNSENVTKVLLEKIGHEKFGHSKALLRASNKEKVIQLILSSLDNLEILDSIANKAKQ